MSFDQTDPWGNVSPWDAANQPQPNLTSEPPVSNPSVAVASAPNPFKIGFTLKAASGYDAEWLTPTVYGSTAEETAQRGKDLLLAMKANGLIEFTAQAAEFTRGQFLGGKGGKPAQAPPAQPSFNQGTGQVQYSQPAQAPFGGGVPDHEDKGTTTCVHGNRTHRTGGNWEAMFCPAREKSEQCPPAWKDKKTGKFVVKG
ncbi:hypothetical protein [Streptomyces globisporus]|uniref:hypothetical protein n=1 Tax=Streptomyces globisporus TaxID=1908 RepID=UPI0036AC4E12